MARGIRASVTGLETAQQAFRRKGWIQQQLADQSTCTRTTISQFFARKPIDKRIFQAICSELELEWRKIAEFDSEEPPEQPIDLDELVTTVRSSLYDSIQEKCGSMRVLDMNQPIGLGDIYTTVNILEKITGRRRLALSELWQGASLENFDRFTLSRVQEQRVPGLEAVEQHAKLMILGKPGAGKTTFLKYLALQCIGANFKPELVPIFITLKDFAEAPEQPSLLNYMIQLFTEYGVEPDTKVKRNWFNLLSGNATAVELLLRQGRLFVLLDGLDEVRVEDSRRILKQIQDFTNQFRKNLFVITCRIAAREYTFEQFTEVEIADFDDPQIASFATKWFQTKQDPVKADRFIERLKDDQGIRDLATSPLLLTLLCLVFEESGSFPANRSELCKEGLDVLLKKWDAKRNIERDQVYKKLSLKRKEDLLSQIALETFEQGNYFFKQGELERYITQYIRNLPDASTEEEALHLDSEAVLKSIEAQHGLFVERARGIYSFSHLTFHEYFTARKIVSSTNTDALVHNLATHVTEKRWREVFLLTVGMLDNADALLQQMKHHIDALVAEDQDLQRFFTWLREKSSSVGTLSVSVVEIRVYYFIAELALYIDLYIDRDIDIALDRALARARAIDIDRALDRDRAFYIDLNLARARARARALYIDRDIDIARAIDLNLARTLDRARALYIDPNFQQALQLLKDQLQEAPADYRQFAQWWDTHGTAWIEQLRAVMIQYRNIGHDWQFSPAQKEQLQKYHDASQLLIDCLKSECYVSREVRHKIESELYMPSSQ